MLIYGHDRELAAWAGERLGIADFGPSVSIGVARKGEIVAVAVFNNYRPPNIEITFVTSTPRWATRQTIVSILRYPFVQLGCKRLTAITEATNQPARAFLCRLGFEQEGFHQDALPSGDAVTYGMLAKAAARWLAEEHSLGKIHADAAASPGPDESIVGADAIQSGHPDREPGRDIRPVWDNLVFTEWNLYRSNHGTGDPAVDAEHPA